MEGSFINKNSNNPAADPQISALHIVSGESGFVNVNNVTNPQPALLY